MGSPPSLSPPFPSSSRNSLKPLHHALPCFPPNPHPPIAFAPLPSHQIRYMPSSSISPMPPSLSCPLHHTYLLFLLPSPPLCPSSPIPPLASHPSPPTTPLAPPHLPLPSFPRFPSLFFHSVPSRLLVRPPPRLSLPAAFPAIHYTSFTYPPQHFPIPPPPLLARLHSLHPSDLCSPPVNRPPSLPCPRLYHSSTSPPSLRTCRTTIFATSDCECQSRGQVGGGVRET